MEDAIRLLKDILEIPSVNGKHNEGNVAEYICQYFNNEGISAKVQKIDGVHSNVIATLEGVDKKVTTVWNGHLDTVPYGEMGEWKTDPSVAVEREGYLYARGASDMKSGLAAMVYALCVYHRSGKKPAHSIQFIGTCDEEKGGLGARSILKEGLMAKTKEILIGEPTNCGLGMAQKGCLWLEMEVKGKTSHGAYPQEGCNAVSCGFEIALHLKSYVESFSHPLLKQSTAQVTQITGGVAPNMTPDMCNLLLDIRMVPGLDSSMVLKQAAAISDSVRKNGHPDLRVDFRIRNDRTAIEIDWLHPMAVLLEGCLKELGEEITYVGINYFTDASILAKDKADIGVLLFGPGDPEMAHKPNERVSLKKYETAIQAFLGMIP